MKNKEIAGMFDTIADILEIKGENPFRVNTYRKTSRIIGDMAEDVEAAFKEGKLGEVRGIGESTLQKIEEYLSTGKMSFYEEMMSTLPAGALEMLRIQSVGPKTVAMLIEELGIDSVDKLDKAIETGKLKGLKGVKEKTIENIRHGIELLRRSEGRFHIGDAIRVSEQIIGELAGERDVGHIVAAGSVRRCRETVHDIDILLTVKPARNGRKATRVDDKEIPDEAEAIIARFTKLPSVVEVLAGGKTKGSVRVQEGMQVDLRVVAEGSFGAALQYFTGSQAHNVRLRGIAKDKGLKVNEYGVFRDEESVGGRTEEDVYKALDLPWIEPELREDRGEIEAAMENKLPKLVTLKQIRGDMHAHSDYSDGALPVMEMAKLAAKEGYKFLVITDHSPSLTVAHGLDAERLGRQQKDIDRANSEIRGFTVIKGTEVDILGDGSVDYDEEILKGFDWVVASVHSRFKMSEDEMTERLSRAAENPYVNALGHPTGRLLLQRDGYAVDMKRVIEVCARTGTALEINAHQDRLDISDVHCRMAKDAGVKVCIGTDSHSAEHFWMMRLGVGTARRGWLSPADVINTWTPAKIKAFVSGKRKRK